MNKSERFFAAVHGEPVDRPPASAWIHFGSSLWEPELVADVHLKMFRDFDWDYIKVMSDYRFPTVGGLDEARSVDDLLAVGDPSLDYANRANQVSVLKRIRAAVGDAPVIDTAFSPFQTVVRTLGESAIGLLKSDPGVAHRVLRQVTDRLVESVRASDGLADGVFFSVNGASRDAAQLGFTRQQFAEIVAPYDKEVLAAAEGRVRILHAHGYDLIPEWFEDYPADVLSWSSTRTKPTLGDVAAQGRWVPMGGLDEIDSLYWEPSRVRDAVLRARRETGDRIVLAPGCTVHSDTAPSILRAFAAAARLSLD